MALNQNQHSETDDWSLIVQAKASGDEKAFAQLFARHKEGTYLTVFNLVKNTELAEDLTMEIFAKAFKNLQQYQPTYSFSAWLSTVAKNHTFDFLRKKRPENISIDGVNHAPSKAALQLEDEELGPEEELMALELNNNVHALLNHLKPRYKKLIEMRYFEEMSYDEMAKTLELPVGTVKAQIFRAKDLLFQILKNKPDQL